MITYDDVMKQDYIGRFMEEGDTTPTDHDIIWLAYEVRHNPTEYLFTLDDIVERCVEVFGKDRENVKILIGLSSAMV